MIGGGGREHALCWALRRSARVTEVVCAPGNGGIGFVARCVPVDVANVDAMVALVESERPGLTVVGPEVPLSVGVVDALESRGLRVFGPRKAAAMLETSKAFAKGFMEKNGIPTAGYAVCETSAEVRAALGKIGAPVVVKADGLAAGKGVVICSTVEEAQEAAEAMLLGKVAGVSAGSVVVEEFLAGPEVSFFALCDGRKAVTLGMAQDHKRIGEGDTGPNTGGMGAYSTDSLVSKEMSKWLLENVAQKTVDGMMREGTPFKGVLFCGIMMTAAGPKVLEFNTRFGDPETQALMMRLETDLLDLLEWSVLGAGQAIKVKMRGGASVCVIAASLGYPGAYPKGQAITGATGFCDWEKSVELFHSGTALRDGKLVTAGGRVLGMTAYAPKLKEALGKAYSSLGEVSFEGMTYRRDIGWRASEQ
ncbi:Phosphoribosylamine--glycine ligase [Granulicella sibirica]|uniref:Phosphoribosylamine--glycine ligase n=1 Tax=Granulicella sibirica TaxID=2479048 RepID=A0A4Q0T8M8_9BACT|nr:Phosphoribosylamine--glycine ligase [Granulicella sibirica]